MISRLKKIRVELVKNNVDAILVSSIPNIIYLTGYSGFSEVEREAFLFITKDKAYVITDGRYSEAVAEKIPHFILVERTSQKSSDDILKELAKKHGIKKLGIEEDDISVYEYKKIKKYFDDTYHCSVSNLRSIKDYDEIEQIKKACAIGDKTFEYILNKIKTEKKSATR